MKLLRAAMAASRSRAWSVAIGRSGLGCHCEKGEPVTARKANHNASNATVVTAGKTVCVSVKYRRPNRWTDQIWHSCGWTWGWFLPKKIDLPTQGGGVEVGILGGQKIKSPGNVMNCPDNQYNLVFLTHPTPGGSGGGLGSTFQKSGKFHELSRKSITPPPKGVAVGILGGQKIKSPGNVMNCREK